MGRYGNGLLPGGRITNPEGRTQNLLLSPLFDFADKSVDHVVEITFAKRDAKPPVDHPNARLSKLPPKLKLQHIVRINFSGLQNRQVRFGLSS